LSSGVAAGTFTTRHDWQPTERIRDAGWRGARSKGEHFGMRIVFSIAGNEALWVIEYKM
jgi:hypothetical protein